MTETIYDETISRRLIQHVYNKGLIVSAAVTLSVVIFVCLYMLILKED